MHTRRLEQHHNPILKETTHQTQNMTLSRRINSKRRHGTEFALVLMAFVLAWSYYCGRLLSRWSQLRPLEGEPFATRRAANVPAPSLNVSLMRNSASVQDPDDELDEEDRVDHEEGIEHTEPVHFWKNFPWDDVNLSIKGSCGVDKCFWPSVSSETYGYLITAEGNYDGIVQAFSLAARLRTDCRIRHLYSKQPPALVNVTSSIVQRLNRKTHNPSRTSVGEKSPYVFYLGDRCVTVAKVVVAPRNHILYGTKWDAMLNELERFRKRLQISFGDFRQRLKGERKSLACALQRAPMYYRDFQGLIDNFGRFFHIDLDGHFHAKVVPRQLEKQHIRETLEDFDRMIQEFENLEESQGAQAPMD